MSTHLPISGKLHKRSAQEEKEAAEQAARAQLAAEEQSIVQEILSDEAKIAQDMRAAEQAAEYALSVAPDSDAAMKAKIAMTKAEADEQRVIEDYNSAIRAAEDAASSRRLGDVVEAEREMKLAEQFKADAIKALEDAEKAKEVAIQAAQEAYAEAQQIYEGSSGTGGTAEMGGVPEE